MSAINAKEIDDVSAAYQFNVYNKQNEKKCLIERHTPTRIVIVSPRTSSRVNFGLFFETSTSLPSNEPELSPVSDLICTI